jgi:acetyltransferase
MIRFHRSLTLETVYARYFNCFTLRQRIRHDRLAHVCQPAAGLDEVLVAEVATPRGDSEIIGVGRLAVLKDRKEGEAAVVVCDAYQRRGVGTELLRRLISVARARRVSRVSATTLLGNAAMQRVCLKAGMHLFNYVDAGTVSAEISLQEGRTQPSLNAVSKAM